MIRRNSLASGYLKKIARSVRAHYTTGASRQFLLKHFKITITQLDAILRGEYTARNPFKSLMRKGKRLYSDFMQRSPARSSKVFVPDLPKVALAIGKVSRLYYVSDRDGRLTEYRHDFVSGSRPLLAVSHDGKSLMLLGGAYRFTHRGIEDSPRSRKG